MSLAHGYAMSLTIRPRFKPHTRWAKRIHACSEHEAWLLAWLPGQGTDLHDHGGIGTPSNAAVCVVEGTLSEYIVRSGEYPELDRRDIAQGEANVVSNRTIHAMRNRFDTPAVSVHVYMPRLESMCTYLIDETGLAPSAIKPAGDDWTESNIPANLKA